MGKGTKSARRQVFREKRALKQEIRQRLRKKKPRYGSKDYVTIYRGTKVIREIDMWRFTDGYICTEAMQDGYRDYIARYDISVERALNTALESSNVLLSIEQERLGGADGQHAEHSQAGGEYMKGRKPTMSWTTSYERALYFANHNGRGRVFRTSVHRDRILNSNWSKNFEQEVLLSGFVLAELMPEDE